MLCTKDPLKALREFDIVDCERTRSYSAIIDRTMGERLQSCDLGQVPWMELGDGQSGHQSDWRGAANLTGQLAFCWANPMSAYHQDARLLAHVKARLQAFAAEQVDGDIVWQGDHDPGNHGPMREDLNLRTAWAIEPLALAANWVRDELADDERATVDRMIRRSADLLMALPCNERNNRAAVRCAVLCLLGHYLGDRTLIDAGVRDFREAPMGIFNADGQINEGPGPDANYSGTSFVYCYTYRIFSGDITVDDGVKNGARWATWVSDSFGAPAYFGAATRTAVIGPDKIADYIMAMERYAGEYPHFHGLIENGYLRSLNDTYTLHVVNPLIWAMFEHNGGTAEHDPDWFSPQRLLKYIVGAGPEFRVSDEGTDSLYLVLRERDNFAITTLIGRFQYKGLQSWNYGLEPPVFWPTMTHASKTRAFGVDTARMRISGSKFTDRQWHEGGDSKPNVLVTRTGEVMNHYLQTDTTLLYLSSCPLEPREDVFIVDTARCGVPIVDEDVVRYDGRQGRMHFAGPRPALKTRENGCQLTFTGMGRTALYAFSNESFELLEFSSDGDRLRFRDDTGTYTLNYETRFFSDDDLAPIGSKGQGTLFLSKLVATSVVVEAVL